MVVGVRIELTLSRLSTKCFTIKLPDLYLYLVGVVGFEPTTSQFQTEPSDLTDITLRYWLRTLVTIQLFGL